MKNRINLLALLHQETEFDVQSNIKWSIVGAFQIYDALSHIKISIVEYQISKTDGNEMFLYSNQVVFIEMLSFVLSKKMNPMIFTSRV